MRVRRLAVAAALAAPLATLAPAAPATAAGAVKIEFVGDIRMGCLGCWDDATISGPGTAAGTAGVTGGLFQAYAGENTTPDLCTSFAQAWGTFSFEGISGQIEWFRSHNALTFVVTGVTGGGIVDGTGTGTAVIVADPVAVTFASCGVYEVPPTFRIAGELTIAG